MSKVLFDDSSDEGDESKDQLTINKSYAENYNTWRRKEEYQTLKDRYGEEDLDSESSSEEEGPEPDNPEFDMDFFRVLAAVRLKHPVLNEDRKFFKKSYESSPTKVKKGAKEGKAPVTVRDHEMNLLLQNGGMYEDDNEPGPSTKRVIDDDNCERLMNQKQKSSFKFDDDLPDDDDGDVFTMKEPAPPHQREEDEKKENPAIEFLKGKRNKLDNAVDEQLLKGLQKEWKTNMSEKDKYLMDFFVNQRYLEDENEEDDGKPERNFLLDFEPLDEDERTYDKMVENETKYRFRFEEPDGEFMKTYPRSIKDTVRKVDTKRKEVRDRKKERMETEKERRKQEIRRMKALRKKEVMERIEALQEAAGGGGSAPDFNEVDLDADFDPEAHDAAMANIFNEDYYQDYDAKTAEKPEDEELNRELEEEYAKLKELDCMPEETFKYVDVCPNSYGLTTEEILYAKDTELNHWYTMKKLLRQGKDENFEHKESVNFAKRAQREDIKRKLLPSLYIDNFEDNWKADEERKRKRNLKKKERRQKKKALEQGLTTTLENGVNVTISGEGTTASNIVNGEKEKKTKVKKKNKEKGLYNGANGKILNSKQPQKIGLLDENQNKEVCSGTDHNSLNTNGNVMEVSSRKKKKKRSNNVGNDNSLLHDNQNKEECSGTDHNSLNTNGNVMEVSSRKKKKRRRSNNDNVVGAISDNLKNIDETKGTISNTEQCEVQINSETRSSKKKSKRKMDNIEDTEERKTDNIEDTEERKTDNIEETEGNISKTETKSSKKKSKRKPDNIEDTERKTGKNIEGMEGIISKIEEYEVQRHSEANTKDKLKRKRENEDKSPKKKRKIGNELCGMSDARIAAYGENPKKVKKLLKYSKTFSLTDD